MKSFSFKYVLAAVVFATGIISCEKPGIIVPEGESSKPDTEVQDTTEKVDTTKPEPVIPTGDFSLEMKFDRLNLPNTGWKTSWTPGDSVNVFSIAGGVAEDDASLWVNHGKFVYDPATEGTFVGKLASELEEGEVYLWHVLYPYSKDFTDPSGVDFPLEDQKVCIGHASGEYVVQKGLNNTDHLSGPNFPIYGVTVTEGTETPEFTMYQMAAVALVEVTNNTSAPLIVNEVNVFTPNIVLSGVISVDFSKAPNGHANFYLFKSAINGSEREAVLKVEEADEIPIGGKAEFYVPVIPGRFWDGDPFTITVNDFVYEHFSTGMLNLTSGRTTKFVVKVVDPTDIELIAPADKAEVDLNSIDRVEFQWEPVEGENEYVLLFSNSEDMSDALTLDASGSSLSVDADWFSHFVFPLGADYGESLELYWSVALKNDVRAGRVNTINLRRADKLPDEERIADPINVKVAIVIEEFEVPGTGKLMHEICGLNIKNGYDLSGSVWNDPRKQMVEFERDLEASSHGVVQYEVVEVRAADRIFTYFKDGVSSDGDYDYLTMEDILYMFETRNVDNATSYDYVGMMTHYGYDEMVDAGELDEIWVYTFPGAGMYESHMIGDGAFWCNSPGLELEDGAPCTKKCVVMCCNYERTTDLALHAYCHRVESIMGQVYEGISYRGWNYDSKDTVDELTNWEKFSAHSLEYDKYEANHAHIGMCHFPPNAVQDYDYGNKSYVYTYADTWYDYPDIKEENARRINCTEWRHELYDQWGYMMWYYDHIPHFKGLCPRDGHLNNWWHYIVQYDEAVQYEKELQEAVIN